MFGSDKAPRVCLAAALASACLPGSISLGNDTATDTATTGGGGSTDESPPPGTTGTSEPTTGDPGTTAASTGQATSNPDATGTNDTTAGLDETSTSTGDTSTSSTSGTSTGDTSTGAEDTTTSTSGLDSTGGDTSGGNDTGGLASCCMIPDMPNAAVSGMTPFGPVDLSWAWYGEGSGQCPERRPMTIYPNPEPDLNEQLRHIEIIMDADDWMNGFQGIGPAVFVVWENGDQSFTFGEVDIVSYDPAEPPFWCDPGDPVVVTDAHFVLSFTVKDQQGWDLTGEVSALYCPEFNELCV